MKSKLVSNLKMSLANRKVIIIIFTLLVIYNLYCYVDFIEMPHNGEYNFYDFIISIFSSNMNIAYIFFFIFLLFLYNIASKERFYQYSLLRFSSRREWYFINIISLFILSIIVVVFIVFQALLEGGIDLSINNVWSEFVINHSSGRGIFTTYNITILKYIIGNMSPLMYTAITMIFATFYFFVISIIYFVLLNITKKKITPFIITFIINFFNYYTFNYEVEGLNKISMFNNISILNSLDCNNMSYIIGNRFIYWSILIILIISVGYIVVQKCDFNFQDN